MKTESDNEKEAVFEVPYEEFAEKYAINQVTPLKEEEAGLMENYLAMFRDIQEVHRIFLNFERQINGFIRYDLYGGYLFLVFMEAIFKKGYLPVSQDADGEFYYDLDSLEIRMKPEMDQELEMVFHFLKESLRREGYRPDRMSHYFILRNFMHAVAEVYLDYYREYFSVTADCTDSVQYLMKKEDAAALEEWEGCYLWSDDAKKMVYVCRRDFRLSTQFLCISWKQEDFMKKMKPDFPDKRNS